MREAGQSGADPRSVVDSRKSQIGAGDATKRPDPSATLGRRVAVGVYVLVATWVIGAGLRSVIPQVFWPEAGVRQVREPCAPALGLLADELERIATVRDEGARRERWRDWDRRWLSLHETCSGEASLELLHRARYTSEMLAAQRDDRLAPLLDEVRRIGDRR